MVCHKAIDFDESLITNVQINPYQQQAISSDIVSGKKVTGKNVICWAVKALTLTDLTTLAGDDTCANVTRLCNRAAYPLSDNLLSDSYKNIKDKLHVAAVCVYPARVKDAYTALWNIRKTDVIPIAAVATGFPTGQYPLQSRLQEIEYAVNNGATEIDIVIDRSLALQHKWKQLYVEVAAMRAVCGNKAHMKTILAIGELGTYENVYKASMVAMMAGTDFIKTSTGKESVNATLPVGLVMMHAIQDFERKTNRKIGLKPAGGVRTVRDAIMWLTLVKEVLGPEWLCPELFRFGASGLLDDILQVMRSENA